MSNEIECPECGGTGTIMPARECFDCDACDGVGWREMTSDEEAEYAERQAEDAAGEPPITLDEQHRAAFAQKQELRR